MDTVIWAIISLKKISVIDAPQKIIKCEFKIANLNGIELI